MPVARMTLQHPEGETPVLVGDGALEVIAEEIAAWVEGRTVFVVSTPRVWNLHHASIEPLLEGAVRWELLEVPEGEAAKSLPWAERLWTELLERGGKRDSRIVAFGGGSVGDLAGFVAGCFLRGVGFVLVPTTLLAQIDAAIGGKTAVNLLAAKNSVGLFNHPWAVVSETRFLATLTDEEVRAGLLEAVKVAVVLDEALFERLEDTLDDLFAGDPSRLEPVVVAAARAKIQIVEQDPRESDLRRLLNFGHTLGHALETELDYENLRHGEAVGYGMLFALRLALRRGLRGEAAERVRRLILRFDLPVLPTLSVNNLLTTMAADKKGRESGLSWILPVRIGRAQATREVEIAEVERELREFLRSPHAELVQGEG